jgi:hypothetical protein
MGCSDLEVVDDEMSELHELDLTASTPIDIDRLELELQSHPDRDFVQELITGLRDGFDTGIDPLPTISFECKNLLSARKQPEFVSSALQSELDKGYMIGPFDQPPFPVYRTNPVGVVEGKYSGKKRLILDMSSPHDNDIHCSLNSLIDKEHYSLSYVTIDDAIREIRKAGVSSLLCRADIADAFKIIPIHSSLVHLHGVCWQSKYYFYTRLPFGNRSSCKIFSLLSQAIAYIATHNYNIEVMLYLLDDYLSVDRPDVLAERTMALIYHLFKRLCIPLALKKTMGPLTVLEYLGVILDTDLMQARLPLNKVQRIVSMLDKFMHRKSCTKRELLSLLGHLNFASRVVVPGRTFVSYLLKVAHSVTELHHHVKLTRECQLDMQMWRTFLATWNGVSFFLEAEFVDSSTLGLSTDASGTIGYGGYWQGQWFQGHWPDHLNLEKGSDVSIAYMELYPIMVAALLWGEQWCRKKIVFLCDNQATVAIVKKGRSKSSLIMQLMRRLVLCAAEHNFTYTARYLKGRCNGVADALSRFDNQRFRRLVPHANPHPCPLPSEAMLG